MASIRVTVKQIEPVTVAFLPMQGDISRIPDAFSRLYSWINEKGHQPRGPAIAVYYDIPGQVPGDRLRWELRSEIGGNSVNVAPDERGVGIKQTAPEQMAATVYRGPYEKMEATYQALNDWISANGYVLSGPIEELYYNDSAKAEELVTEIRFPCHMK